MAWLCLGRSMSSCNRRSGCERRLCWTRKVSWHLLAIFEGTYSMAPSSGLQSCLMPEGKVSPDKRLHGFRTPVLHRGRKNRFILATGLEDAVLLF